jgi:ribosomal protein L28
MTIEKNKTAKIKIASNITLCYHKIMTKQCQVCGKGQKIVWRRVKLRGKYNPTTKRKQKPNLQWFKFPSGKRILVCTKCKKLLTKEMY